MLARPLLLLAALAAPSSAQDGFEPGSAAPPGRWITAGGCAARTGRSLSRPVRAEPEVAWRVQLRGEIEGEPRIWNGTVLVAVREGPTRRALHALELETGRTTMHQVLPASLPLELALWGDLVAVRPEQDRVDVYRRRGQRLFLLRTIRAEESVSAPLLFEQELYLRVDDELVRYDRDRREPVWTARVGGEFRGRPSLRGDGVYGLWYEKRGLAKLAKIDRSDGRVVSRTDAGHHDGRIPTYAEDGLLFVHDRDVFLRYPLPVPSSAGPALTYGRIELGGRGFSGVPGSLYPLLADPVPWHGGWIAPSSDEDGTRWLASRVEPEGVRLTVLADRENHPELLTATAAASLAGNVLYLGPIAADLTTYRILWRRKETPLFRPVPADGMLLVVERPDELVALREGLPELGPAAIEVAHVVDRLEDELAEGFAGLAHRSLRLGDHDLSARLVAEAVRRGAQGRTLEAAQDGVDRLAALRRPPRPDPRRTAAILEAERGLLARSGAELVERAKRTNSGELARAYLRAALAGEPEQAEAVALVRGILPADAPVSSELDAKSWLDFLDVDARIPVAFVRPPASASKRTAEEKVLAREVERWRRDLVGHRSDRLHVVSPAGRPGAVARCLEMGELVCDLLEEIFETSLSQAREPMTLLLYDSQQEYVDQSRQVGSGPELVMGWTAGHYSGKENLSRMYVPEADDDLRELLGVYAHELTHHWLATRAPFARRIGDPTLPGYWIAEGFATMIEEFELDPRARTWKPDNPRAESLDTVANALPEQLLEWETVFRATFQDFSRLDPNPVTTLPLTWRLGMRAEKSALQMFYAQAGAACHTMYRTSPETRAQLVGMVRSWYEGERRSVSPEEAFGATPEELGERIVAYAREAIRFE